MAPYEALYGRKCRSPLNWDMDEWRGIKNGQERAMRPNIIQEAIDKMQLIKQRIQTAQSQQKSYADKKRKDLKFEVRDYVLLKVSPIKGIKRTGKKGKLHPRFVGPFEVIERIGTIDLEENLAYEIQPVKILNQRIKELRGRPIQLIKVLWKNDNIEEAK
ncbi:uncharacterized protein [Primulina eburnea]|uniref:uncharacterized protein n=1 Tax=Primulina eburnea TaxID=1245227 RepID=UPI003C6C923B